MRDHLMMTFVWFEYAFRLLNDVVKETDELAVAFDELYGFIENYSKLRGRERISLELDFSGSLEI